MKVIDYVVGHEAGLEGRLLGILPVVRMTEADTMFRGEAMRYLAELMWNPDALLLNRQLDWCVLTARTLAVATGEGSRRCETRLILDAAGDVIRIEADDRPRQNGRVVTNCPWFGRANGIEQSAADASPSRRRSAGYSTGSNSFTGAATSSPGLCKTEAATVRLFLERPTKIVGFDSVGSTTRISVGLARIKLKVERFRKNASANVAIGRGFQLIGRDSDTKITKDCTRIQPRMHHW